MIHPMLKQRGDSGFVVAADVISEKELKGCFVSQTMSLKLSSFFKKKKKIRFYPKADVPNPKPLIQACWRPLAWSSAGAGGAGCWRGTMEVAQPMAEHAAG